MWQKGNAVIGVVVLTEADHEVCAKIYVQFKNICLNVY